MQKRCRPLLGTFVEIEIGKQNSYISELFDKAFASIEEVHFLMNFFDTKSDVARLNSSAYEKKIQVNEKTWNVLKKAQEISLDSDGAFDIAAINGVGNFHDIELLPDFFVKFSKKISINLNGIAKGYAVDLAAETLEQEGVSDYIINAGGDLRVGKVTKKIAIRNPKNPQQMIAEIEIENCSLATSANYFSEGKKFYNDDESFSVLASSCLIADALTKIVASKKEKSAIILSKFNAEAIMISNQNQIEIINKKIL